VTIIEIIYLGFGGFFAVFVAFLLGYTRHEETRARLLRMFLKKNFGIVEIDYKGGFSKRLVHDFSNTLVIHGRADSKKAFVLDKQFIKHEGNIPLARFVEDDASTADNVEFNYAQPVSKSEYKVPPENLNSIITLIKTRAAAKAAFDQKMLLWLLVIVGVFALLTLLLVYVNFGGIQAILEQVGLEGGINVGAIQ